MTCTREKSSILACMALASSDKEGGGRAVDERLTRLVWSLRRSSGGGICSAVHDGILSLCKRSRCFLCPVQALDVS